MESASPGFGVGAVARRLGVAASTLRTWDRRYGIGPSRRSEGRHRRYDAVDVARLEMMHHLILTGLPPTEAARMALAANHGTPVSATRRRRAQATGSGSGGNRLAVPGATREARALSRAVMAMDEPTTRELIWETSRRRGVVWAWENMLVPVLNGLGERYSSTGRCIEIEHLLTWSALATLSSVAIRPGEAVNARPALLACAAEEQHSLPLYALAAALAKRHVAARVLGARVPYQALADAVRRLGPAAVFVWSQTSASGDPGPLADLPAMRPAIRVIVGGPGWNLERMPQGIEIVQTLPDAVTAVLSALGVR
jgi:MerR family transcriptional regulator, light-induced transcriptional regulator